MSARETVMGPRVKTDDGSYTLEHGTHGETFHSTWGAASEARELYIVGSGFEAALAHGPLAVLDVGLGLGYNAMATIEAWMAGAGDHPMEMTSLEIDLALVEALATGQAPWQDGWSDAWKSWCGALREGGELLRKTGTCVAVLSHPRTGSRCRWRVVVGDASAREVPRGEGGGWTHVWQDAFSPQKNPAMWTADWFRRVGEASARDCVMMSYSAARVVKDAMGEAGWTWRRIPGSGKKRDWLRAEWRAS